MFKIMLIIATHIPEYNIVADKEPHYIEPSDSLVTTLYDAYVKYTNDLVEKACANTNVNIPECMIEDYAKDMKASSERQAAQYNIPFEMYLQYMGYTLESFEKQAKEVVAEVVRPIDMPFVTERWPGGMLTNFATIRKAVKKMNSLDKLMQDKEFTSISKRERLQIERERAKLDKNLGSIADLVRLPAALFIVDINKEHIAVAEARRLNIPTFAIVDTNCNPDLVDFPIPANDDAVRSVKLITSALADAVIEAKEGISPKAVAEVEEELVDIKTVLDKTVPNLELAESGDEEKAKARKKKPAKKPVAKTAEKSAEAGNTTT